eukprot:m.289593 g.289593  ORF g.289593 m.289593 type:complete len:88 (-) comp19968_c0_seq3:231-494(-)
MSSSVTWATLARGNPTLPPALLNKISSFPHREMAASMTAFTWDSSLTSHCTNTPGNGQQISIHCLITAQEIQAPVVAATEMLTIFSS